MGKTDKIMDAVLGGHTDHNIAFADLLRLLWKLGFVERVRGSHHIFSRRDIDEIINLQPKGAMSKGYQVKQVRGVIFKYKLRLGDDE